MPFSGPPFSESASRRVIFLAGGVFILNCMIMLGDSSGLRMIGGFTGSCLLSATCWLFTYLALSASRRSTALSFLVPGSAALRKYSGPLLRMRKGMAEVKGPPARRPSVGRRVSTGMINLKDGIKAKGQSFPNVQECPKKVSSLFLFFCVSSSFSLPSRAPFTFLPV